MTPEIALFIHIFKYLEQHLVGESRKVSGKELLNLKHGY